MKKFLVLFIIIILISCTSKCFAKDVIILKTGQIYSGKITFVGEGMIIIKNNGLKITLNRESKIPVFNDTIDVRKNIFSKEEIKYIGKIEFVDQFNVIIKNNGIKISIPRFLIKNITLFIP